MNCKASKFLFENKYSAWLWLIVRVYVGYEWLIAGWGKIFNPAWTGSAAGSAIKGFVAGALAKTAGAHPDVPMWYAWFLKNLVLSIPTVWSYLVAYGELFVGIGLILGAFTCLAAFFGIFMNFNYLMAGTVSLNPTLLILGLFIIMAKKVAGLIGLDYYIQPWLKAKYEAKRAKQK